MEVLHTLSRKKLITLLVLLGLLVLLAYMSIGALRGQKDYIFLLIGGIHLVFAADYIRSYLSAYHDVLFSGSSMELVRNKKCSVVEYAKILRLEEKRNNYIEIFVEGSRPFLIHGEFAPSMDVYAEARTVNILRKEIKSRSGKEIETLYKRR